VLRNARRAEAAVRLERSPPAERVDRSTAVRSQLLELIDYGGQQRLGRREFELARDQAPASVEWFIRVSASTNSYAGTASARPWPFFLSAGQEVAPGRVHPFLRAPRPNGPPCLSRPFPSYKWRQDCRA
jgi:hypothetical protein